jgi:hypothetical protein
VISIKVAKVLGPSWYSKCHTVPAASPMGASSGDVSPDPGYADWAEIRRDLSAARRSSVSKTSEDRALIVPPDSS